MADDNAPAAGVDIAEIYRRVSPSVLSIEVGSRLFDAASGTGFVVDDNGHIVTNAHVVEGAQRIFVVFNDGIEASAELIGIDRLADIAVIKVEVEHSRVKPVVFGNSDDLAIGESVLAIGNPYGLERTLTTGIISGLNRDLTLRDGTKMRDMIQTDAALNPGNSGGPMFNLGGEVVGVNTLGYRSSNNLGFAIPSNLVQWISESMIAHYQERSLTVEAVLTASPTVARYTISPIATDEPRSEPTLEPAGETEVETEPTVAATLSAIEIATFIDLVDEQIADFSIDASHSAARMSQLGMTIDVLVCATPGPEFNFRLQEVMDAAANVSDRIPAQIEAFAVSLTNCADPNDSVRTIGVARSILDDFAEGEIYAKTFQRAWSVLAYTDTPVPSNTPEPIDASVPTNTPVPSDTHTPVPTDTPVRTVTSTDLPVVYTQDIAAVSLDVIGLNSTDLSNVSISASILDAGGQLVSGLDVGNFSIGGDLAGLANVTRVENVTDDDLAFATVLVIDASSSMADRPLRQAKQAARQYVKALRQSDPVAIVTFGTTISLVKDYTADRDLLLRAIDSLTYGGQTALYDATFFGIEIAKRAPSPRRAVVILSDGGEYSDISEHSLEESIRAATVNGAPVYTVGLGWSIDRRFLEVVSAETNAEFYDSPRPEQLLTIFQNLAYLFRTQYIITMSADVPADGTRYDFSLEVIAPDGRYASDIATLRAPSMVLRQ